MALEILTSSSRMGSSECVLGMRKAAPSTQTTNKTILELYVSLSKETLEKIDSPLRVDVGIDAEAQCLYIFQSHAGVKIRKASDYAKRMSARIRVTGRTHKLVDYEMPNREFEFEVSDVQGKPAIKIHCSEMFRNPVFSLAESK